MDPVSLERVSAHETSYAITFRPSNPVQPLIQNLVIVNNSFQGHGFGIVDGSIIPMQNMTIANNQFTSTHMGLDFQHFYAPYGVVDARVIGNTFTPALKGASMLASQFSSAHHLDESNNTLLGAPPGGWPQGVSGGWAHGLFFALDSPPGGAAGSNKMPRLWLR